MNLLESSWEEPNTPKLHNTEYVCQVVCLSVCQSHLCSKEGDGAIGLRWCPWCCWLDVGAWVTALAPLLLGNVGLTVVAVAGVVEWVGGALGMLAAALLVAVYLFSGFG